MKIIQLQFLFLVLLLTTSCSTNKKIPIKNGAEMVQFFSAVRETPIVIYIQKGNFTTPIGGHLQGIQQLDKKHLVITGSSNNKAYFFITKMRGMMGVKRRGAISKMIYINDDFPNMRHNHASGIQLFDNLLAIGTEGGTDPHKSSVVFYDLTDPDKPQPLKVKINRQEDTAGAIGLTRVGDSLLLAVGGWDSDRIDFYRSPFDSTQLDFHLVHTWHTDHKDTHNWTDRQWGTYQSLNFVKDEASHLHLIGFYQNDADDMIADLYQVHLTQSPTKLIQKIGTKRFYTQEGASFKNGAGLSLFNYPKRLHVLATERNWGEVIRVNYW